MNWMSSMAGLAHRHASWRVGFQGGGTEPPDSRAGVTLEAAVPDGRGALRRAGQILDRLHCARGSPGLAIAPARKRGAAGRARDVCFPEGVARRNEIADD